MRGNWQVAIGCLVSMTGIGALFGIPLILAGIHAELCEIEKILKEK